VLIWGWAGSVLPTRRKVMSLVSGWGIGSGTMGHREVYAKIYTYRM